MLAIKLSLKVTQAVISPVNTYEQDIIAVGDEKKKLKTNINENVFIVYLCYH